MSGAVAILRMEVVCLVVEDRLHCLWMLLHVQLVVEARLVVEGQLHWLWMPLHVPDSP